MATASTSLERPMPHNVEAERSILGAILLDNNAINPAIEKLKPEDFFHDHHRRIYAQMIALGETVERYGIPIGPFEALISAFEQDQHQRKRTEPMSRSTKDIRIDPVQHWTDDHARKHQDDDIGHAGEAHQSVRDERQHEQTAKHREK